MLICRINLIFLIIDVFLSLSPFFFIFLFFFLVQFGNKVVAQAACDVFQLLISHWERLQRFDQSMPKKTIEVTETTQTYAKPSLTDSKELFDWLQCDLLAGLPSVIYTVIKKM